MRVTIYGAGNEVTGSCYLLETASSRILVDCGMFQGGEHLEGLNKIPPGILSKKLDAVLLTHGHLDHCGRLPLLVKNGYRGVIFATAPTVDIATLILNDAEKIQQDDLERENRKRLRDGLPLAESLFNKNDVEQVCKQFRATSYNEGLSVTKDIDACYVEAGHILGSASIELSINENNKKHRLVFSGDLGQWNIPLMKNPSIIDQADVVFMESTYGDRDHRKFDDTIHEFYELIKQAVSNKGKILIPTFAVGRTQLLLLQFAEMFKNKIVSPFSLYLDSPMAIAATELYAKYCQCLNPEAQQLYCSGHLEQDLQTLKTCTTVEESKALNDLTGPFAILAGAGMCNAGRILHHLRNNLSDSKTLVIIVGYQAKGSLGRMLVEGAKEVKIFGERIQVRATVKGLGGFSAHAGQTDLLKWLQPMAEKKAQVVLVHGEDRSMKGLASAIKEKFGIIAEMPEIGDVVSI